MNEKSPICVLVADDHPVVREGLVALIEHRADMTVVAQASNGQEAIALFQRHQPDVTLLDLRMPEMDGLAALAAIRETFPEEEFKPSGRRPYWQEIADLEGDMVRRKHGVSPAG